MIELVNQYRGDEDVDTPPNASMLRFDIDNTGNHPELEMSMEDSKELLFIQQAKDDNTLVIIQINKNKGEDPNQSRLGGVIIRLLDLGWEVCCHPENGLHRISQLAVMLAMDTGSGLIQSSVPGAWWREYALRIAFGELQHGLSSIKCFNDWAAVRFKQEAK